LSTVSVWADACSSALCFPRERAVALQLGELHTNLLSQTRQKAARRATSEVFFGKTVRTVQSCRRSSRGRWCLFLRNISHLDTGLLHLGKEREDSRNEEFPLSAKKTLLLKNAKAAKDWSMTETNAPKLQPLELTAEEAKLLSDAASSRANEFVRSGATSSPVPELAEVWKRNAATLRNLAVRLANLK
jgi:hypothetical protein